MTTQDYYTWHVGIVLDSNQGWYSFIVEWIKENLSKKTKEEAIDKLADWLKDWIEDAVYEALDAMDKGLGATLINEVVDFNQVDWMNIAEGYLEDYKPDEDEDEETTEEIADP